MEKLARCATETRTDLQDGRPSMVQTRWGAEISAQKEKQFKLYAFYIELGDIEDKIRVVKKCECCAEVVKSKANEPHLATAAFSPGLVRTAKEALYRLCRRREKLKV